MKRWEKMGKDGEFRILEPKIKVWCLIKVGWSERTERVKIIVAESLSENLELDKWRAKKIESFYIGKADKDWKKRFMVTFSDLVGFQVRSFEDYIVFRMSVNNAIEVFWVDEDIREVYIDRDKNDIYKKTLFQHLYFVFTPDWKLKIWICGYILNKNGCIIDKNEAKLKEAINEILLKVEKKLQEILDEKGYITPEDLIRKFGLYKEGGYLHLKWF